jgi:predicted nuclease of predicted toxin-antitoxin system
LSDLFPNSLHVGDVGLKATIDPVVWDYAKDNNLMIVSKDADMHDLSLYQFHKVVLQLVCIVFVSQHQNIRKKNVRSCSD